MVDILATGKRGCERRSDKNDFECSVIESTKKEHELQMDLSQRTNHQQGHLTDCH